MLDGSRNTKQYMKYNFSILIFNNTDINGYGTNRLVRYQAIDHLGLYFRVINTAQLQAI